MLSLYCNFQKPNYGNREQQAENWILCTKQFWFRVFIAEIENLKKKIQTWNSKIEKGKTITMWSFYCYIGELKFENRESQAESQILCRSQFSLRAWIAEIENLMLKIQNGKPKDENRKSISMRSFYCHIGKPKYGIREPINSYFCRPDRTILSR